MFSICPSACPCMRVCGHAGGRHSLAYCLFYGSFYVVVLDKGLLNVFVCYPSESVGGWLFYCFVEFQIGFSRVLTR